MSAQRQAASPHTGSGASILRSEPRYGVYFVPGDDVPLARFGFAVLGRDAEGRRVDALSALPGIPADWTETPARYGFHATLKAPFRLRDGHTEAGFLDAVADLAARFPICRLNGLAPRALGPEGGFTALSLPQAHDSCVDSLAAACVTELDGFRAPMSQAERQRRQPERLDAAGVERLDTWGYSHVLEGFRFHMTLSRSLEASPRVSAWQTSLADVFTSMTGNTAVLDRLAVCREATPSSRFVRVAEFPLGGG